MTPTGRILNSPPNYWPSAGSQDYLAKHNDRHADRGAKNIDLQLAPDWHPGS